MPQSIHSTRHVFVYGTLRRGGRNDIARFEPPPLFVGYASVHGTLYDLGGYPGVVLDGSGRVAGEVYAITESLEAQLDRLEEVEPDGNGEYIRREVRVRVGNDELACLVYEIHPSRIAGRRVIGSGDWFSCQQREP
ncbi:gamma-glutamylcyclotransferase [Variovorax sp. KK3]|uniref:gamma-glutamylcyclotransferase family protein n=1 Tax=Variovorax sp. KK3 TaxID=1855728 RepID=UPI00097C22B7|nr:gamma-glutamylcyclotransferase family protein [Variovorax sp. KK3]